MTDKPAAEPGRTPGKAEGTRDPAEQSKQGTEPARTPGSAEGEREPQQGR